MLREITIPEKGVSAATLEMDGNTALILAKNGNKVSLITARNGNMSKSYIMENYRDNFTPFISKVGENIAVFTADGNTPVLKPIGQNRSVMLKSPYLKRARVSGRALEFGGRAIVPALGVPYGCKFSSALVFASDDMGDSWRLLSFVVIAEDFGYPIANFKITRMGNRLVGLIETLPLRALYTCTSEDAESWSRPRFTGIIGANAIPLAVKGRLFILCSNRSQIQLFSEGRLKRTINMEKEIRHLDAFSNGEAITAVATLGDGESKLIEVEI